MHAEYRALLDRAARDPEVRVIVVTGSGRGFCAGADSRADTPLAPATSRNEKIVKS